MVESCAKSEGSVGEIHYYWRVVILQEIRDKSRGEPEGSLSDVTGWITSNRFGRFVGTSQHSVDNRFVGFSSTYELCEKVSPVMCNLRRRFRSEGHTEVRCQKCYN